MPIITISVIGYEVYNHIHEPRLFVALIILLLITTYVGFKHIQSRPKINDNLQKNSSLKYSIDEDSISNRKENKNENLLFSPSVSNSNKNILS